MIIAEWNRQDRKIVILYANEFDKLNYEESIDLVFKLIKQYGKVVNVGIDMSSLELIMSLKKKLENDQIGIISPINYNIV